MSSTLTLTPEQSKLVRELDTAVTNFGLSSAFRNLLDSYQAVAVQFKALEAAFPEIAKRATEYHEEEFSPYSPSTLAQDEMHEAEGYQGALFSTLLSLWTFYDAEGFNRVASSYERVCDDLYALCTFSPEYNVERGCWNENSNSL